MQVKTLDLKERKIRVNAVSPGVVPTPGYDLVGLTKEQVQAFVDFRVHEIEGRENSLVGMSPAAERRRRPRRRNN